MADASQYAVEPDYKHKCAQTEPCHQFGSLVQQYRTVHYTSRLMPTCTSHSHGDPRFKASRAKEIIGSVLKARLTGAAYHADNTSSWAREIADDIKAQLKGELECGVGGKCA